MFNSKKTREDLEKTRELYKDLLESIMETKNVSDASLFALDAGNVQIEKNIEDLEDILQERSGCWGRLYDKAAAVYSKMETLEEIEKKRQENGEALKDNVEKVKKAVDFTGDIDARCGQLDELEEKSRQNWEKQFQDSTAQIEKMQDAAGNMAVLALNAAVEAGKLGGIGKDFLQAAEEVRQLSESYNRMLGELSIRIKELQDFSNKEKELRKAILTGLHKKLEGTDEWREDIASLELDLSEDIRLFKEQVNTTRAVADGVREACQDYEDMEFKLEALMESNEGNKQAAFQLKEELLKVYGKAVNYNTGQKDQSQV